MFTTRRSILATAVTVALTGIAALGVAAPASAATTSTSGKIGICQATGSTSNPYVYLYKTVDTLVSGKYSSNDIIPSFTYSTPVGDMIFNGQNTSGVVLTADCLPVTVAAQYAL